MYMPEKTHRKCVYHQYISTIHIYIYEHTHKYIFLGFVFHGYRSNNNSIAFKQPGLNQVTECVNRVHLRGDATDRHTEGEDGHLQAMTEESEAQCTP